MMTRTAIHPLKILTAVGVAFVLWGLVLAYASSPAQAATITVNSLADDANATDGECTLREAITSANTNTDFPQGAGECAAGSGDDVIDIGATGTVDLTRALPDLSSNIEIKGPGADQFTVRRNTEDDLRIFTVTSGSVVSISRMTIANGLVDIAFANGGGIHNTGTLTISGATITGNVTIDGHGGGIYNTGTLTVSDSTFSGNSVSFGDGGGIFNEGTLTVSDSTFSGNKGTTLGFTQGGAIANHINETATVSDSTFSGNIAGSGGAIHNNQGSLEVSNSTFSGNTTFLFGGGAIRNGGRAGTLTVNSSTFSGNSSGAGGAIQNFNGTATVNGSNLSGNIAAGGGAIGGAIINDGGPTNNDGGTLTVNDSTLSGNSGAFGGAINNNRGTATVNNSTLSGNSVSANGGGISNAGTLEVNNSTISGNSATEGGGVSHFQVPGLGNVATLKNTIVANSPTGGNCFGNATITDGGGNLAWPAAASASCPGLFADPKLGQLQDNGGPTHTHALQPGSAAIDSAVSCPPPSTDQRGVSRPQGAACDIGAYEFEDNTAPVLTVPADITAEATSPDGAVVTFNATAEDDVEGSVAVDCTPAPGSTFSLGTTTVTCKATDNSANSSSKSFSVTVVDTTAPSLNLPDDKIEEATGPGGAAVTFSATASDLVDGDVEVSCTRASGSTFDIGITTVSCSAEDSRGNFASGSFTVTVRDTTSPAISNVPSDITQEATSAAGAAVSWDAPTASDLVDGNVNVNCESSSGLKSGDTFPLGTTEVTCSASDSRGNTSSATFDVTVGDTTAPSIDSHADITGVEATDPGGAVVNYTKPNATDAVDPNPTVTCSPAPGATFPLGTTTVSCSAIDAAGNESTKTFNVTVEDTTAPTVLSTTPLNGATKVSRTNPDITATFSEPMAFADGESSTSFTLQKVRVQGQRETVLGTVTTSVENPADGQLNPNIVRLSPAVTLDKGSYYRVTITTSATDVVGNELQSGTTWRFKTAPK